MENTKEIDKNEHNEELSSDKDSTINHNELLARLNELEKEEQEEEEKEHAKIMNEILEGTYKADGSEGNTSGNNASVVRKGGEHKHVQFDSDVDDARNSYSDGEHEGIENVIKFQHSSEVQVSFAIFVFDHVFCLSLFYTLLCCMIIIEGNDLNHNIVST